MPMISSNSHHDLLAVHNSIQVMIIIFHIIVVASIL
jgi:hypothetical protein